MVKIQSRQSALRQASRRRQMLILGTFLVASMVYLLTRSTPSDAEIHEKNLLQVKAPKKPKPPNAIDNLVGKVSCGGHHAASCAACSNPEKAAEWCNGDCMWNTREKLCEPIGKVSCGGHYADSCAKCTQGHGATWCNGDCYFDNKEHVCKVIPSLVHPAYRKITDNHDFQQVRTEKGQPVNIILVKRPMAASSKRIYQNYKDDILFFGISSFENFPLSSPNPFSHNFSNEEYKSLFPGWLTMMRHPEEYFTSATKTILMSQSDFQHEEPLRFYQRHKNLPKKYDFVFSGTDQNVDDGCVGWASFAKNWTFMLEALEVMCSPEFNLTGVLIANTNKKGTRSCDLPPACQGKMLQTKFLPNQSAFFEYTIQSRFMMVPQIYDASPRVVSQALALNVPILMNRNIVGGWKYLNNRTGEGFHDISDFKEQLGKMVNRSRHGNYYQPQDFLTSNYGTEHAGKRFRDWVEANFQGRVEFPPGSKYLVPWGS